MIRLAVFLLAYPGTCCAVLGVVVLNKTDALPFSRDR